MATLTGQRIKDSYKDLLQVSNSNSGITTSLTAISDGEGTASKLEISSTIVNINTAGALYYAGTQVTSTAAELNILDGATVTVAELNILDGVTASATDINLIDGITNGTVIASKAIITDSNKDITGGRNITISGELDAATLDISGDADIDGTLETDALTIGGVTSVPFEAADHSKLDGIEASADVTDTANVTSAGALMDSELASIADVKALDQSVVSGATPTFTTTNFTDASNKRLMTDAQETKLDSVESNATADQTDEEIQDIVGAMFTSTNTETGITATYQDATGDIDLVVGTLNQDTTGTASKATVTDSTANTNFPVVFHDEGTGNVLLDDTGALRYNPSTGELLVPKLTVAGTTTTVDTVTMEAANAIKFEGATADANETILSIVDPTNDDNTQYLLNASGYIPLLNAVSTTVITATPTELNYVDGVTSNIQTQLDATLDTAGTGIDISSTTVSVDVSDFMSNGADNRVLTATGTDAMNAEANLTFDGTNLDLPDSKKIRLGTSQDLEIYHDGTNSVINNTQTGALQIYNNVDDGMIELLTDNGSGGTQVFLRADGANNMVRMPVDNVKFTLGAASDLQLYHDGSNNYLRNNTTDQDFSILVNDGGSTITALQIDSSEVGRVKLPNDNQYLSIGASGDLYFFHDGTNSVIRNATGDLVLRNDEADQDIILQTDDGSGGIATYITLDGSTVKTDFNKPISVEDSAFFPDNSVAYFGAGNDLRLWHSGTESYVYAYNHPLYIGAVGTDQDVFIRGNDGGASINAVEFDMSDAGTAIFNHDVQVKDNGMLKVGTGTDLQIYHDGTHSYLANYTGDLDIYNNTNDGDISFFTDDGSGGTTPYITLDGSATFTHLHQNTGIAEGKKLFFDGGSDTYITSDSADFMQCFVGNVEAFRILESSSVAYFYAPDNAFLGAGTSIDFTMSHDGTNSQLTNNTGDLYIRNNTDDGDIHFQVDDSSTQITAMKIDASAVASVYLPNDNQTLGIGAGNDLRLFHDGTDSYMYNYQGELRIGNTVDDADTAFWGDNGSGGMTPYITLDGSAGTVNIDKEIHLSTHLDMGDGDRIKLGDSDDLQFVHDSNINFIHSTISDRDIYFRVNDGDSSVDAIIIDASEVGKVRLPNDNQRLSLGASDDLDFIHDGSNSIIGNATGDLTIKNFATDKDIILMSDDGSGGETAYLYLDGSATDIKVFKNTNFRDSVSAQFGDGADANIVHDGSHTYFNNGTGNLYIQENTNDGDMILSCDDGSGGTTAYLTLDGSAGYTTVQKRIRFDDDVTLALGTSPDTLISSNGSNTFFDQNIGNLFFRANTNDGSIHFQADDGSGGLAGYMDIDGQNSVIDIFQDIQLTATKKLYFDTGANETYISESANDILNLYVGGENMLEISAAGSDPRVSFFNKDHRDRDFSFNGDFIDHAVYFDSSAELLLIGTNTGIATVNGTGALQVLGTGNGDTLLTIGRFSNNTSAPAINFAKSRNGTIGSHTIVQDDDSCGEINWTVSDGSDFISYIAQIEAEVDGTPGSNDVPGRLMFKTTADGAAGPTEHFRISQDGALTATDTSIGSISDKRIKKDIKNFTGGLELISKLTPRTFKYRSPEIHFDGVRRGFIAQEVQAVDEYWIDSYKVLKDNEDYQYVKDTEGKSFASKLTDKDAMYVSAIQELKREIDELKLKLGE